MSATTETPIDEVDVEKEKLSVRGKNLSKLILEFNFYEAIHHLFTGKRPHKIQQEKINQFMIQALNHVASDKKQVQKIRNTLKQFPNDPESALISSLLIFENTAKEQGAILAKAIKLEFPEGSDGLFLISLIPWIISLTVFYIQKTKWQDLAINDFKKHQSSTKDFISCIFKLFTQGRTPNQAALKIFHALLVGLHAGFGIVTPTVILSRFSASTGASTGKNLIAALTGCGPSHVGACNLAMDLLKNLDQSKKHLDFNNSYCHQKPFPGFGHPLLKKDPRNNILFKTFKATFPNSKYQHIYHQLTKFVFKKYNLNPNIDLIAAAIMLELGFKTGTGTAVFLFSRMPAVLAHILEKKKAPPFGIRSEDARQRIANLPKKWI